MNVLLLGNSHEAISVYRMELKVGVRKTRVIWRISLNPSCRLTRHSILNRTESNAAISFHIACVLSLLNVHVEKGASQAGGAIQRASRRSQVSKSLRWPRQAGVGSPCVYCEHFQEAPALPSASRLRGRDVNGL